MGSTEIAPSGVSGADVGADALSAADIDESGLLIPRAWAVVSDPGGNSQPDGDPRALAHEGVRDINDGDGGPLAPASGRQCYGLGFVPDLILASIDDQTTVPDPETHVFVHKPGGGVCGPTADDAYLLIRDVSGDSVDGNVHVAFFDLE